MRYYGRIMTGRQFYDWQTAGGGGDVLRLVETLEREEISWCAIGGIAVNYWAEEPIATAGVDITVAGKDVERAVKALETAGFAAERFEWSVNLRGSSKVSVQISTEDVYHGFPERSVPADVHGILLRVASLQDTLQGKLLAFHDGRRRRTKRQKDLLDIMRLVESHPELEADLPPEVREKLKEK